MLDHAENTYEDEAYQLHPHWDQAPWTIACDRSRMGSAGVRSPPRFLCGVANRREAGD